MCVMMKRFHAPWFAVVIAAAAALAAPSEVNAQSADLVLCD
jgi:hypothetical protein